MYKFLRMCGYNNTDSIKYENVFYQKYDTRDFWQSDITSNDYIEIRTKDILKFINNEYLELTEEAKEYLFSILHIKLSYDIEECKYIVM